MSGKTESLDQLITELAREPNPRRRRQVLAGHRDAWRPETVSRFYEEVVRLLHVDVLQAERIARAASTIAEGIADEPSLAASLRALAHIYYRKRQYKDSVDLYERALEIYERVGDEREAARTLNSSLQSLIYLG